MNTPQTPDYGEPWQYTSFRNCIRDRHDVLRVIEDDLRNRSRSCVNACAGMADPSKEIEELKECRTRYIEVCANIQECVQKHDIGLGGEKLDQLVCAEIEAMRQAIKEAHGALRLVVLETLKQWDSTKPLPCVGTIENAANVALAKLKPFIKP